MADLNNLGERKIIDILIRKLERMPNSCIAFGDDVATVKLSDGKVAVLNSDMLVHSTDVPKGMNLLQTGRKAVIMAISDLASKGVQPLAILSSLALPSTLRTQDIQEIAEGLNSGAREYDAYVIGGDTNRAGELIIDCLVFGVTKEKNLMKRSGAKPGDILATTGLFGDASSGLKLLSEGLKAPENMMSRLLEAVYLPKSRMKEGLALAEAEVVTCSIDSSDGLAWSLNELATINEIGFEVDYLPASSDARKFASLNDLDLFDLVFHGGEEYELVLTVSPSLWEKASRTVSSTGGELIRFGRVTKSKRILFNHGGKMSRIEARGWDHFR